MAVTSADILGFLNANPGISDAEIVAAMEAYGVSPAQMAQAVGVTEGEVAARVAATVPPNQAILLGDTYVQAVNQVIGSGEDQQIGGLENVITYKAGENQAGGGYNQYNPDGTLQRTGTQQKVAGSFLEGLGEALTDPVVLAALAGGYGAGLFGGAGALGGGAAGATALTAGEIAALTAGDLAIGGGGLGAFAPLTAAEIAGLTAADLAIGAGTPSALSGVGGLTAAGAGSGALSGGAATTLGGGASTTLGGAGSSLSGLTAGSSLSGLTAGSSLSGLTTGAGALTGANTLLGGTTLGSTLGGLTTGVVGSTLGSTLGSTVGSTLGSTVGSTLANTAATGLGGLTAAQLGALLSGGLTTAGGLLQQQTSATAATKAQKMIDDETAAAKTAAAFRPVGMTTRFGTSKFGFDPKTGQLTSAGYTLSPEAKYAQDKLTAQANLGLQQIELAQGQFAPLQTGAQSLFKLGQGYLAQTPETVAKDYLASQMALLKPGRELELANLQNRLQQQGRGGLAVAQGGTLGATTPELQALFNARATQEAQLAANAQQAGQQNVLFGAGLLGQGAGAMGQYYAGQQAAYAPYTTALGQMQALETAGQQPLSMSAALAQQSAQAGANVGRLGLSGAEFSTRLATGPAATTNPYSTLLSGLGASPAFGQAVGGLFL